MQSGASTWTVKHAKQLPSCLLDHKRRGWNSEAALLCCWQMRGCTCPARRRLVCMAAALVLLVKYILTGYSISKACLAGGPYRQPHYPGRDPGCALLKLCTQVCLCDPRLAWVIYPESGGSRRSIMSCRKQSVGEVLFFMQTGWRSVG